VVALVVPFFAADIGDDGGDDDWDNGGRAVTDRSGADEGGDGIPLNGDGLGQKEGPDNPEVAALFILTRPRASRVCSHFNQQTLIVCLPNHRPVSFQCALCSTGNAGIWYTAWL